MIVHKQRHDILKKFYHRREKLEKTEMSLNVFLRHAKIYTILELRNNEILLKLSRTHLGTALQKKE
jgi:hypothetical protein